MAYKLQLRRSIYNLVGKMAKKEIVNIFRNENISLSTMYQAIRECEEGIPCSNLPKSGRPRKLSSVQANRLIKLVFKRFYLA